MNSPRIEADSKDAELALQLLAQARKLRNQTIVDSAESDAWHKQVDQLLKGTAHDDPAQRWDDPARVDHRQFVQSLFERR